uniref:Tyrosine-protein kinase ephrin type A/B receptor-like domain-containing protein n=1 Tax=Tetradesmus obliquus TaxID=3088 RepID=A0A383V5L6_TETOB|eukprot:jgi/Sobl393_1/15921/SZX60019.1
MIRILLAVLAAACLLGSTPAGASGARRSLLDDAPCSADVLKSNPGCVACSGQSCIKCGAGWSAQPGSGGLCYCPAGTCGKVTKGSTVCRDAGAGAWSAGGSSTATTLKQALGSCNTCSNGLTTKPTGSGAGSALRYISTKPTQCVVAPGKFLSKQQSVECPKGKYQPRYLASNAPAAKGCLACPRGTTTKATGAVSQAQCTDLKAGFFVRRLAMAPRDSSSISSAPAAAAALAPGFEVQECPEGSYQPYEGEDPVYNCTSCGVGLKTDGTGATSSEACYIDEGFGSQLVGGVLTAYPCPADTFRQLVATGIMPVDCDPCPAATNTKGKTGARSEDGCDGHAAGYGADNEGTVVQCPVGSFNPANTGNWLPCTFCKFGRSTLSDPAKQVAAADCLPKPGHGLQLKQGSFDFTFDQLQAEATARQLSVLDLLADLPMDECPAGSFSAAPSWAAGLDAAAKALAQTCQPCANGAATTPGSSGAASCSAADCPAGSQKDGAGGCKPCSIGSFKDGTSGACEACDPQEFNLFGSDLGAVRATTLAPGASSAAQCVPTVFSVEPDMTDRMLHPGLDDDFVTYDNVTSLKACVSKCTAGAICIAGREKDTGDCKVATYAAAAGATAAQLGAAQATVYVKAAGEQASSSYIALLSAHTWEKSAAADVADMPASADDAVAGLVQCKAACSASSECVAVVYKRAAATCTFKKASVDYVWVGYQAAVVMG